MQITKAKKIHFPLRYPSRTRMANIETGLIDKLLSGDIRSRTISKDAANGMYIGQPVFPYYWYGHPRHSHKVYPVKDFMYVVDLIPIKIEVTSLGLNICIDSHKNFTLLLDDYRLSGGRKKVLKEWFEGEGFSDIYTFLAMYALNAKFEGVIVVFVDDFIFKRRAINPPFLPPL